MEYLNGTGEPSPCPHQRTGKTYTWTYDNAGNILSFNTYAYTRGTTGTAQDTVAYGYDKKANETDTDYWGDLLISYDGVAVTYEYQEPTEVLQEDGTTKTCYNIGNPTQLNGRTYTWEHGRRLKTMTMNGVTWTYTYNNAGLRTGRVGTQTDAEGNTTTTDTYEYVYNGSQLVRMIKNGEIVDITYDAAGTPLTMTYKNNTYYYVVNIQGDVEGLLDADGQRILSYYYNAYGQGILNPHDLDRAMELAYANPLGYRGYVMDVGTFLYYCQSRYYDATLGRFLNADGLVSTGQGILGNNMFAYCGNNPVIHADFTGYDAVVVVRYVLGEGGLPIVGHIYVYVQNFNGAWIMTEYASYTFKKKDAKVYTRYASEEEVKKLLESDSGIYGVISIETVYIEGDFSKSAALAWQYLRSGYGKYCLFTNNCKHYVHEILSAGNPECSCISAYLKSDNSKTIVPRKYIRDLMLRKELGEIEELNK